jgi:hypothetical protein
MEEVHMYAQALGSIALATLVWVAPVGLSFAQTADGETPADEFICDGQVGAAFGLCNAYCEAMDCDSLDPQASETACNKIYNSFQNITGAPPPCEAYCPCVDLPTFGAIVDGSILVESCSDSDGHLSAGTNLFQGSLFPPSDPDALYAYVRRETYPTTEDRYCVSGSRGDVERIDGLTPSELDDCRSILRARAAESGIAC